MSERTTAKGRIIGYFDGVDPRVLTRWVLRGLGTLPISNGADGHGTYVARLSGRDVSVVVAHLHKLVPPKTAKWETMSPNDLVYPLKTSRIPLVVLVEEEDRELAKRFLRGVDADLRFCSPEEVFSVVLELLGV